jgi:hypothetical protein
MNNECEESNRCPQLVKRMPCNSHSCNGENVFFVEIFFWVITR